MNTFSLGLALSTATAAFALGAGPALADIMLPAPYVSRALDAVLLPIDQDVRTTFGLTNDDTGVLVLATEPGGVADANDIVPGDVLHMIGGQKISSPIEVDEIVYYWILEGVFDFDLGIYRDGGYVEVISTITEESYWEEIEITSIETWSSWEVEASFSYEEYYAEYSEEIVESYETSETLIEETVTSEEYMAEMSEEVSEETYEDEYEEEEISEDAEDEVSDEDDSEEDLDEEEDVEDEGFADEESEEEFAEEEDADEVEEEAYDEEESYDEPENESADEGYDEGEGSDEG